jgi:putative phosphoesterase
MEPETAMRLIVLSDTHVGRKGKRDLPSPVWKLVEAADAVLHAGDIKSDEFLERLQAVAVTYAVAGNNDVDMARPPPDVLHLELAGVSVGMIHDAGPSIGRAWRMQRRFPDASLVVFGHSHVPVDVTGTNGQRLFNPGSPTLRRRQPHHTIGELVLEGGEITDHRLIVID